MKNIYIRPINESDIEIIRQWRNQDDVRNNFIDNSIISIEQQKEWYANYLLDETDKMFIIIFKKPIGCCSLYDIDSKNKKAEFGKLMIGEEKNREKKYAQDAVYRICRYGFNTLGLENIYLSTFEDNIKAVGLYKKLGFKEVGEKLKIDKRKLIYMTLNKFDLSKGDINY